MVWSLCLTRTLRSIQTERVRSGVSVGSHHARMAIDISIIFEPAWERLRDHLVIDEYNRDGSAVDPRIRIGFDCLPESWARELVLLVMPCVTCRRPNFPLRRREGDPWDRLYYAPTCPVATRVACSRSRAVELEYERFKGLRLDQSPRGQLALFG